MKISIVTFLAASASATALDTLEARDGCIADNCLRAVRANRYGTATMALRMNECNSYLAVTETPAASTIYITVVGGEPSLETSTIDETPSQTTQLPEKRQETDAPTPLLQTVPAYATACPDLDAYTSACTCFGASAATATAPAPTVTSTVTVTAVPPSVVPTPLLDVSRPTVSCSKPWTCGHSVIPACSAEAGGTGCVCFRTVEGRDVCALPNDCHPTCDTTSDCGSGEVCIKQSCCVGGTCMKVDVCLNAAAPKMMFKRRGRRAGAELAREEFARLSMFPHDASAEGLE